MRSAGVSNLTALQLSRTDFSDLRDTARAMSQENVEAVQRWIEAYNVRDLEALIELTDPDCAFRSRFVGLESLFRAYDGFPREYFELLDDAYERFVLIIDEFIDAGAGVLTSGHAEWRGKTSGVEGQTSILPAFWLRAKRVLHAQTFTDRSEALEAVGLSE
jgi:hypothetical protein